jgi:hypothetical protein
MKIPLIDFGTKCVIVNYKRYQREKYCKWFGFGFRAKWYDNHYIPYDGLNIRLITVCGIYFGYGYMYY